jgi:nucleotide-binding universal stress UspA family protein
MSYKRILVPVDGSAVSNRGLTEAVKMARAGRAKLRLLHVVDELAVFSMSEAGASIGPILESVRAAGKRKLARIARRVRGLNIRTESALVEGVGRRVADFIVDDARRWRADVIVMGTHGRRGVKRMLLGSDAELVIRYSPVPVLLVPGSRRR